MPRGLGAGGTRGQEVRRLTPGARALRDPVSFLHRCRIRKTTSGQSKRTVALRDTWGRCLCVLTIYMTLCGTPRPGEATATSPTSTTDRHNTHPGFVSFPKREAPLSTKRTESEHIITTEAEEERLGDRRRNHPTTGAYTFGMRFGL
jgi:hypothetical protein